MISCSRRNRSFVIPPATKLGHSANHEIFDDIRFFGSAQGHGRIGLIALALLSTQGSIRSYEEGFSLLKRARPGIGLNNTQETFIRKFFSEQGVPAAADKTITEEISRKKHTIGK